MPGTLEALLRFLRSAGFRFAVRFALIFIGATAVFALVFWYATAGSLDRQTDAALRTDALSLVERWREAGSAAVAEAIGERLASDVEGNSIYLLINPEGRRLAGNLDRWPQGVPAGTDWAFDTVQRDGLTTERPRRSRRRGVRLGGSPGRPSRR